MDFVHAWYSDQPSQKLCTQNISWFCAKVCLFCHKCVFLCYEYSNASLVEHIFPRINIVLTSMLLIISKFGTNSTYMKIIKPGILCEFERYLLEISLYVWLIFWSFPVSHHAILDKSQSVKLNNFRIYADVSSAPQSVSRFF